MTEKQTVKFGDICREVKLTTKDPIADGYERYIGLEHLDSGSLKIKRWGLIAEDNPSFTRVFKKGQILFGKRRPYLKKAAIAEFDGICSSDILVLEPSRGLKTPQILPFIVHSDEFWNWAVVTSSGSLSPRTKFKSLASYSISLSDDKKKLDALSNVLWKAASIVFQKEEFINQSELLLQVLMIEKLYKDKSVKFKKIGELCEIIDPNPSHRYPESVKSGIPLVSTENFEGDDGFLLNNCKYVSEEVYQEQNKRCRYSQHDIVFARKGRIGLARFFGQERKCFSHTVVLIKPNTSNVLPKYLLWVLRSLKTIRRIEDKMNSNSGVPTLGLLQLAEIKIPVLSIDKQLELVNCLDGLEYLINQQRLSMVNAKNIIREVTKGL